MSKDVLSSGSTPAGFSLDKSTALALGFGLHNAWVCSVMYSTHAMFDIVSFTLPGVRGVSLSFIYLVSIAAFCLLMVVAAGFDQKLTVVSRSRKVMGVAAAVTCVGTLVPLLSPTDPHLAFVLECCAGVLTGIGSAVLMLYWGIAFAREKTSTIAITGSIAVALGFALSTLFLQSIPAPFSGIVSSIIPLLEFLILKTISPKTPTGKHLYFNALPTSKARLGVSLILPMALVGFALGVLKQTSVQTTLEGVLTPSTLIILLLAGSLTISLFTFQAYMQKENTWDRFFRILVPALACAALLISIIISENTALSDLFLLVAYIFIETLMWVYFAYLSHKFHLSPIFLYGLSRGILTLFMLVGAIVVLYANPWLEQMPLGNAGLIIAPLVLVALGSALMPRESELGRRIVQCPAVRLVALELDEDLGLLENRQPEKSTNETAAHPGDPGGTHIGQANQPESKTPNVTTSAHATVSEIPPDVPASEARKAMLPKNDPDGMASGGRFSRKIKTVAKTYLLTERETDILFELAKGNSPTYIQEKYFISAGTVKTHIRNVYRKLNVHKRNDLIRLIEKTGDCD